MTDITLPPGAPPALGIPRADVAFYAWNAIRNLGQIICWPYDATEGDPSEVLTTTYVQVECRAATMPRAYQIADRARRTLKALPWVHWDEAVISEVTCLDGPRWVPDENGGPRYTARYEIGHHPRQGLAHA